MAILIPTWMRIVVYLHTNPKSNKDLAKHFRMFKENMHIHIKNLEAVGMIRKTNKKPPYTYIADRDIAIACLLLITMKNDEA